jgi:deoxyribose-phosphate aldolase
VIDHTLLKPDATPEDIDRLCDEATVHRFAAVCVHPVYARRAVERLRDQKVAVASVVGFPHGATLASVKRAEARELVARGVRELDMVLPIGQLKACEWNAVADDIDAVVQVAHGNSDARVIVKVIIETGLLTDREKVIACAIAEQCGADYVKTSTGFSGSGATVADVRLMRQVVGDRLGVKAAGGIRTREHALALVAAGATRIGTSSGPALVCRSPAGDRTV